MSQSERAYQVLQTLTAKETPPSGENFDSWTLRVVELLTEKVKNLELEVSKLKVIKKGIK
jgi:hypothetical protein